MRFIHLQCFKHSTQVSRRPPSFRTALRMEMPSSCNPKEWKWRIPHVGCWDGRRVCLGQGTTEAGQANEPNDTEWKTLASAAYYMDGQDGTNCMVGRFASRIRQPWTRPIQRWSTHIPRQVSSLRGLLPVDKAVSRYDPNSD
ncbi:hypothetical protein IV203_009471 [Nitzschia inconspicua]|uniref:Uncharacterized protein n=1 Tax=Nitzschia inconspicua TaxID=303405 RepID=A0A9K3PKI2_9STRA|nr:hypothetical protein IV203_009471 [Nitzschia inconspicua]